MSQNPLTEMSGLFTVVSLLWSNVGLGADSADRVVQGGSSRRRNVGGGIHKPDNKTTEQTTNLLSFFPPLCHPLSPRFSMSLLFGCKEMSFTAP